MLSEVSCRPPVFREGMTMKSVFVFLATITYLVCAPLHADHHGEKVEGEKPFVLIARLQAAPGKVAEVIALSAAADRAVKAGEPGMLLHTFDRNPDDALGFVWTELYENSAALEFHLQNPDLIEYLDAVNPLLDAFTVELYGEVSKSAVDRLRATETPTKHFKTELGYIRDLTP